MTFTRVCLESYFLFSDVIIPWPHTIPQIELVIFLTLTLPALSLLMMFLWYHYHIYLDWHNDRIKVAWYTVWKLSKYDVFSGLYFTEFRLNTEIYFVLTPNLGKYEPERTPYLETFYAVKITSNKKWVFPLKIFLFKVNKYAICEWKCSHLNCVESVRISEFFWFVFSLNAGKYGPKKLRIRTLFMLCY